jgi:hypothetical protein
MLDGEWVTAMMTDSGQVGKGREACLPSMAAVFWLVGVGEVVVSESRRLGRTAKPDNWLVVGGRERAVVCRGCTVVVVVVRWWWRWADLGAAVKRVVCQDLPLGWLPALACSHAHAFACVARFLLAASDGAMWRDAAEAVSGLCVFLSVLC